MGLAPASAPAHRAGRLATTGCGPGPPRRHCRAGRPAPWPAAAPPRTWPSCTLRSSARRNGIGPDMTGATGLPVGSGRSSRSVTCGGRGPGNRVHPLQTDGGPPVRQVVAAHGLDQKVCRVIPIIVQRLVKALGGQWRKATLAGAWRGCGAGFQPSMPGASIPSARHAV